MLALRTRSRAEAAHDSRVAPRRLPSGRILVLAAALLAVAACRGGARAAPAGPAASAAVVKLAPVAVNTIEDASEYVASIQSLSSTELKPEVSGEVTRILVQSGDRVRAGHRCSRSTPAGSRRASRARMRRCAAQEAAATFADQQLERAKMLFAAGAVSQQELDQAQANYDSRHSRSSPRNRPGCSRSASRCSTTRCAPPPPAWSATSRSAWACTSRRTRCSPRSTATRTLEVYVPSRSNAQPRPRLGLPVADPRRQRGTLLARTAGGLHLVRASTSRRSPSSSRAGSPAKAGCRSSQYVRARIVWRTGRGLAIPVLVGRADQRPAVRVRGPREGRAACRPASGRVRVGPDPRQQHRRPRAG